MDDTLTGHFQFLKQKQKERKQQALAAADTEGWTEHSPYHFSKTFKEGRVNWWPSTHKAQFKGEMYYGKNTVDRLLKQLTFQ